MPVNLEVKGSLAKCLATENLIVEHRKVGTASFDVDRRVLTLPMWEKASNRVYDLLVGHEVGHALYTPNEDWKQDEYIDVPMGFVNVVEDARIEKLMKRRYAGLSKTFYKGYQELHDEDFFSVEDEDMSAMSLIDRLNLHYKIGAYYRIPFSSDEQIFVDRAGENETWDEVLELSYDIFMFLKTKNDQPVPKKINLEEVIKAIKSILRIKEVLGANNGIYKSMMAGLNDNHEVDFEELLKIPEKREVIIAKSCIQLWSAICFNSTYRRG